jgi:hypothetical protein
LICIFLDFRSCAHVWAGQDTDDNDEEDDDNKVEEEEGGNEGIGGRRQNEGRIEGEDEKEGRK